MTKQITPASQEPIHNIKGLLLASIVIPTGIAAWVILWQFGFIASFVAFGIAYAAVWLYKKGAGDVTRKTAPYLIGIIVLAIILSFLGGMMGDAWAAYSTELGGTEGILSGDFLGFYIANLASIELWQGYAVDLLISIVFAALGAGGVIRDLYLPKSTDK